MSSDVTLFVPDGLAAPDGARALRVASASGTAGTLVEVGLPQLGRRLAGDDVRLQVAELDGGQTALTLGATRDDWDHSSLAVSELDTAIAFYRELLAFEVDFAERGMNAQVASITGVPGLVCDLAQLQSPVTAHTLELIAFRPPPDAPAGHGPLRPGQGHAAFRVPDLEAALAEVERLGGQVLGDLTRFENGRSAYCREPGGSYIELTEPAGPAAHGRT